MYKLSLSTKILIIISLILLPFFIYLVLGDIGVTIEIINLFFIIPITLFFMIKKPKKNLKDTNKADELINNTTSKIQIKKDILENQVRSINTKIYDFITIDFETANNELKSACSVGIAAVKNNEIVDTFYTLLNPPIDFFDVENSKINGIYKKDVVDSLKFIDVWKDIYKFISNSNYVVAHNSNFDMSVLKESLYAYNIEIPSFKYFDSISFCSKMHDGSSKKLSEMCGYFDVELVDHHNGLEDAKACASIVICALNKSRFKTIYSYLKGYPSITINQFSTLVSQKAFKNNYRKPKTRISEIEIDVNKFDVNHPLYDKTCVITGKFESYDRDTMTKKILDVGGIVRSSVSKKTDYLIVGQQDNEIVGVDGMSNKEETAYELIEKGHSIEILNELDFLDYFK